MDAPLALYRRYRPDTFSEVIGQDHVTAPLRNALSNNRVNHAYLFSGPRGCGKTTSARILARAINCEQGPIAEPCGRCQSCQDLARGGPGSIDVIEIDAASHGGVDDARDLRERAFFSPVQSRYKIYIIDEAHMVTTQGFNALLKLVEEPPPHLKFIFATTEPDKVIGTIRSRTHHYPFRLVPPKVLADYLAHLCDAEGVTIAPAALPLVVRAGAGSVRDSLSVLDQLIGGAGPDGVTYQLAVALLGFTPDSLLDACMDGFAAHDSGAVFEVIDKVIETGQDPKRFAEDLLRRLRDLVILSAVPSAVASGLIEVAEDQGERLQTQAAGIGPAELTRAADIVAAGLLEMRGATAPRLQLELICAKVLLPGADDSTNGIQARLDRIERRLTIGVPAAAAETPADSAPAAVPTAAPAPVPAPGAPAAAPAGSGPAAGGAGAAPDDPTAQPGVGESAGAASNLGRPGGDQSTGGQSAGGRSSGGQSTGGQSSGDQSAGGRAAAPETAPASSPGRPATSAQSPVQGALDQPAAAPASSGAVGLADVRRLWPEILEAVKSKRRFAWIMLSQNAQVIAIDEQTITLGLVNAGARESFARSGSDEILRQAMVDTIGLSRRVEAVVDPSTDPGATSATSAATSAASAPPQPNPAAWNHSPVSPSPSTGAEIGSSQPGRSAPAGPRTPSPEVRSAPGGDSPGGGSPDGGSPGGSARAGGFPAGSSDQSETSRPADRATAPPGDDQAGGAESGFGVGPSGGARSPSRPSSATAHTASATAATSAAEGIRGSGQVSGLAAGQQAGGPPAPAGTVDHPAPRREQAASKRRAAEAAVAAERANRPVRTTPVEAPLTPEEEAEAVGEDDVILVDDSRSHTDLLRDTLGAQIITEEPN